MTSHCSEADPASGESTDEIGAVKNWLGIPRGNVDERPRL